ncbi:MAG: hypothetical protein LH478_08310 [Chitinophagaceae bacterium]|nr:hypothetical protein [Chitinophagaceae bacterium]
MSTRKAFGRGRHIHLLIQAKEENLSDILHDFKKFTSQTIIRTLEEDKNESRPVFLPGDALAI